MLTDKYMIIETMRVKNADHPSGFVIINTTDFDAKVHEAFVEGAANEAPAKPPVMKDLPAHLEGMTDVEAIKALAARDERPSAAPLYAARLQAIADAAK